MLLSSADILTYHNDVSRSGQNLHETILTPRNVNAATFGKRLFLSADGKVDAQPLYVSGLSFRGRGKHNVVYVATEHDSVFAYDSDTGTALWQVSVLGAGEVPSDPRNCGQVIPEIGITSTPVIDRHIGPHGTIYLVAMSKDGTGNYFQRLHALDLSTGAEEFGGPRTVQAAYPGTGDNSVNGNVVFDPGQYDDRAALLLSHGVVYTTWASHCDIRPYTSWVIGYNARTLKQAAVLNLTPNGNQGAFWNSGGGPAADSAGNLFLLDGNGSFDSTLDSKGFPAQGDFGNAFLQLSTRRRLHVADYFATFNQAELNSVDFDFGSGQAMVLPAMKDANGRTRLLAIGAGKDGSLYLVDRRNMGKLNTATRDNHNVYQQVSQVLTGGVFSTPAYFNGSIYYGAVGDHIRAFRFSSARLSTNSVSESPGTFAYPGASPTVSANGRKGGIVWAVENGDAAALHAYDATNLANELYNSNQAGARDQLGLGNKFITPAIAGGKVFVGTTDGVAVYGLL
ncbi:MAG: outer rane biosis protein BamB [Phycisphaerales bacterium]|nr:outer rane biosis protein BamB [Phycisphaerales bacterium]MDB5301615.1 outer rane biosis protein BamB [Phycisphaerales bacterium]MDB5302473.1 outer rane biosis protein BamB [Phycisphaerales bacterium]